MRDGAILASPDLGWFRLGGRGSKSGSHFPWAEEPWQDWMRNDFPRFGIFKLVSAFIVRNQ